MIFLIILILSPLIGWAIDKCIDGIAKFCGKCVEI